MTRTSSIFAHEPLPDLNSNIRILSLLPGCFDDRIECLVARVDLNEDTKYDALSYVWGEGTLPKKDIYLENSSMSDKSTLGKRRRSSVHDSREEEETVDFKRFPVTPNLEAALRQLRSRDKIRHMWADAICINQEDPSEVRTQVQRMGQIYAMASQVSIWLGKMSENGYLGDESNGVDVRPGLQYVHHLKRKMDMSDFNWFHATKDSRRLPASEILRALEALCQQPWFSRVWVQQEHILAKLPVIHCGPEKMKFADFGTTIRFVIRQLHQHNLEVPLSLYYAMRICGFGKIFRRQHFLRKAPGEKLLITLLNTSGFFSATKPRDKVFGVLGLVHQREKSPYVTPDDEKSLDEFHLELTKTLIVDTASLALLQGVRFTSETLPSWVSQWNVLCGPSFKHYEMFKKHTSFNFSADDRILHTKAIPLGKVIFTFSNIRNTTDNSGNYEKNLGNIEERFQNIPKVLERYSGTTNARLALEEMLSSWRSTSHSQKYYVEAAEIFSRRARSNVARNHKEDPHTDRDKVIFVVSSGAVGSLLGDGGFVDILKGDYVFLFPGCTSQHMLRRYDQGYRVLCRCTVDGFQDLTEEEHLTMLEKGPWADVSII